MYGLWLYKDLATEYGKCRVEIHQKEYNGESIEIEAFAGDSLSIALDNLSEIISPIGKSVCSFGIINTNQFNYDILFTPDATKFMVVVKTMVTGQEWITRWSGFLTPDFFAEDLQYRSIISLSARDGIGQLNDIDFTYDGLLLTIQTLIQTAFSKVSPEYPMEVVIDTKKVIDGYTLDSVYIAADLFKGKSWGEAIETVLHDCGLQMRWIDNNTIAIYDLSAMPEQFANQSVQFINGSGYREILPAWKTLSQNQDYKTRGNLYDGVANAELMVLDHSELAYYPFGGAPQQNYVNYYKLLSQWTTAWNAYTGKNMNDPLSGVYISGAIDAKEKEQNYIFYKRDIQYSNYPVKIKLKTSKTIHYCEAPSLYPETLAPYDLYNPADPDNTGYVQLSLFVSIILHADNGQDYYLGREWYQYNNTSQGMSVMKFTLNQATYGNISAEDIEIEAQGIPYNGELSIRIHGYQMEDFKYVRVNDNYPYPDWNAFFAKIEDVTIEFDNNNLPSGVNMGVTINEAHNIKKDEDYTLNTLPNGIGGETAIVNGLYNSNGNSLYFAQLNNQTEEYTLLELVGREAIHYNIKNYEKLSGDIKAVDNKPLLFNSCYKYNGKTFIPYAYSLSVISNTMNITSMQEVEPYVTAELTEIHSEIATGGGSTVGGGNNIALQYSSNAGNAKRIYELDNASEDDVKGAYIVVDRAGLTEAKKFNLQDIAEMTDWFTLQTLESGEKVLMTPYNLASQQSISWKGVSPSQGGGGGGLIQRVYGYDNITDVFDNSVKTDTFNAYTISQIAKRVTTLEEIGVGGDVDLTGYATEDWVLGKDYATNTAVANLQLAHNTLRSEFDALNNVLNDDVSGKINTWNEVVDFLDEYSGSQDLATILAGINGDISTLQGYFTSGVAKQAAKVTNALTFGSKTYDGSAARTITASDLGAITSHQDISHLLSKTDAANTYQPKGNYLTAIPSEYITDSELSSKGFATQSWVIQQAYLSEINTSDIINALGYLPVSADDISKAALISTLGIADWALAASKPSYEFSEILNKPTTLAGYGITDALSASGGIINSESVKPLTINSSTSGQTYIDITNEGVSKSAIGWTTANGSYLYNPTSGNLIGIKDDGTAYVRTSYTYYDILHAGNYTDYALSTSGGTISGTLSVNSDYNFAITNNTTGDWSGVRFRIRGTNKGFLGIDSVGKPIYIPSDQSAMNVLLHSGNVADYALPIEGGTINSNEATALALKAPASLGYTQLRIYSGDTSKGVLQYNTSYGFGIHSSGTLCGIYIADDSKPKFYDANSNAYEFLHEGNFNSYALPKSGGTIEGSYNAFEVKRSSNNPSVIKFSNTVKTLGYIGVDNDTLEPVFHTAALDASHYLIHSGNIGDYAPLRYQRQSIIDLNTATNGFYEIGYSGQTLTNSPTTNYSLFMDFRDALGHAKAQFVAVNHSAALYYRAYQSGGSQVTSAWKTIAFIDSNVASATKLQTARTLWGQSFDGTGNIDGKLRIELNTGNALADLASGWNSNYNFLISNYNNALAITVDGVNNARRAMLQVGHASRTYSTYYGRLLLNPFGGNVLIGTTTDDGTSKLQVAGNISATGSISWGSASDRRLKDNIKTISNEDAINVIMALNPVTFEWNKTATEKDNSLKGLSCGFVADEYTKVIPNSSRPIWEEYDAIDYKLTAAFLVKIGQSHEERLRVLEIENRELKNELNKLRGYGN